MRKAFLIILLFTPALSRAEKSFLPAPLEGFLGPPPSGYEQHFLKAARELKSANELLKKKNWDGAIQKLLKLGNGEMGEHALFTLTSVYREKNEFSKSSTQGEKLLKSFPLSLYAEKVRNILDQNECRTGSTGKGEESIQRLLRCFSKTPWKNWNEIGRAHV